MTWLWNAVSSNDGVSLHFVLHLAEAIIDVPIIAVLMSMPHIVKPGMRFELMLMPLFVTTIRGCWAMLYICPADNDDALDVIKHFFKVRFCPWSAAILIVWYIVLLSVHPNTFTTDATDTDISVIFVVWLLVGNISLCFSSCMILEAREYGEVFQTHRSVDTTEISRQKIEALTSRTFEIKADDIELAKSNSDLCIICLAEFYPGESVRELHCHHRYHAECFENWVIKGRGEARCPMQCNYRTASYHASMSVLGSRMQAATPAGGDLTQQRRLSANPEVPASDAADDIRVVIGEDEPLSVEQPNLSLRILTSL
jgi:hypothetical protein